MTWICAECGYQSDERWLMCPECTTDDDWAEARALLAGLLERTAETMRGKTA